MALFISYDIFSQYFEINMTVPSGLVWKKLNKNANTINNNSQVGCLLSSGYYQVKFKSKKYYVHRIIYSLYNKVDLDTNLSIDHIDRNKANNSPLNLRLVTHTQNMWNQSRPKTNKSGFVTIHKKKTGWQVKIKYKKKIIERMFSEFDDAVKFRNETIFSIRGTFPID
jgi:hypothetical protein